MMQLKSLVIKPLRIFILSTVLSLGTITYGYGQESQVFKLNGEAVDLYKQGRFQEAITRAYEALQIAEKTTGQNHHLRLD